MPPAGLGQGLTGLAEAIQNIIKFKLTRQAEEEQRDLLDRRFNEQKRQFDVGQTAALRRETAADTRFGTTEARLSTIEGRAQEAADFSRATTSFNLGSPGDVLTPEQEAMFEALGFPIKQALAPGGGPSVRGSTPQDIAAASSLQLERERLELAQLTQLDSKASREASLKLAERQLFATTSQSKALTELRESIRLESKEFAEFKIRDSNRPTQNSVSIEDLPKLPELQETYDADTRRLYPQFIHLLALIPEKVDTKDILRGDEDITDQRSAPDIGNFLRGLIPGGFFDPPPAAESFFGVPPNR